ncbi:MAG: hypothetical protein FWD16_04405, partial [Clostridia bacterium]|nr:hypothetical protein [Clostridia bacterium]
MKYTRFHTTRLRAAAWLTVLAMVAALIPMGLWLIKATDFAGYDSAYGIEEGQDGSLADPYFISTAEELQNIGRAGGPAGNATDLTKHYALKADIDLFDLGAYYAFTPIAPGGDTADCFSGSLDGDNGAGGCYKISNLLIPMGSGSNNYGLFGNIGGDAVISNLEIETALNSSGYGVFSNDSGKAGVLAGYTNGANDGGSIANVTTRGVVHSGFAAGASGARAGGLVGASDGMTITDCVNYADIWVGYVDSRGGGIAGDAGSSDISGCTNYGSVFGGTIAGGIAGSATAEIRYENLTNYGHVRSGNQPNPVAGGIAGAGDGAEFYRCFNYGELTTGSSGVSGTFGAANGMGGITNYRFIREFDDPKHAV